MILRWESQLLGEMSFHHRSPLRARKHYNSPVRSYMIDFLLWPKLPSSYLWPIVLVFRGFFRAGHMLSPTTSEAKWKGDRLLGRIGRIIDSPASQRCTSTISRSSPLLGRPPKKIKILTLTKVKCRNYHLPKSSRNSHSSETVYQFCVY